ncbi:MAG: hypothetical protein LQ338_005411 [Usnochroma carphineum]|nr:MAG: hypothetical protein LQ338_005411 [Usnochroma carphineum]
MNAQCMAVSMAEILKCSTLDDLLRHSREGCSKTAFNAFHLSAFHHDVIGFLDLDLANHVELVMPVLPLQESLLSESFQNPSSYWTHHFFELGSDEVDVKRLEKGWEDVAQCTDALRTSFCPTADIPRKFGNDITFVQLIHKNALIDWLVISCSETCFKARARDRAREIAEQCQAKRFTRPLWAITLFSLESRTVMMFSIHHALRDEPSLNIIMSDLRDAYTGDPASPVKDRHQLRDAIRLLHTTDGDQGEQAEQFWAKSLSSFADGYESKSWPELRLADTGQSEGTLTYSWNAETSYSDLRVRAASLGAASLAAVLRTVWGCILLEYLETDKVVFAETWSARGQAAELSGAVAPLVFVLPVPFQAQGTWRKALESTTDLQQQSKTHYGVHPSRIRKILSRPGGVALYPAVFNFVPDAAEQRHDNDESLWRRIDDVVELSIEHAIAFNAFVADSGTLKLELTALKQCMDQEHLHVLSQQVMALLDLILDNPDGPVTQLSTQLPQTLLSLTPIEKDPAPNLAWTRSPTECVDHFAVIHPHWIAAEVVSFFDWNGVTSISWSYEQLQKAYQNVAAMIGELGYRRRRIAVCLDRCLDLYAVVLGIMSTGNTYLPIADDLPEERKLFLLQDSDAAMLFTTRLLAFNMSSSCCTIFVEDVDYSKPVKLPSEIKPLPTDDAYLLYTSGSTGTPKGVLVSRGNVTSFIEAISHFISSHVDMKTLQCRGKWLGMASYAFDVHLLEMFFPWRHGMATVTAPRPMLLDNLELALQKLKVTHASFVPSLADNAGLDPANLPDLRYLSLGGEKISKKAIDVWSRSHVVLVNAYGPTEVTIGCCFRRVEPATNVRNIGYALPYTVAHVLRPGTMHYVLRGTSGELCLTGDLVATGYHDRPDAKGFVEDSHGKKMYRTGDRVRLMADGSFEFLGREDDQTKVRGQRVELGEVSEAVRSAAGKVEGFEAVDVVSLVAQHPSLTRPQLVTFLATQQSSTDAVSDTSTVIGFSTSDVLEGIRTCCRSTLPSFMVPDHLVRLTCLPLVSASRKVDMKQLRTIFNNIPIDDLMSSNTPESSSAHALNEEENSVRATVAEVLAVEQVGLSADSNLLQYGLDSLNAISLTFKLQRQGLQCSVSKILKNPTIRAIASGLRQRSQNGGIAHMPSPGEDLERRFRSKSKVGLDLSNAAAIRPCLPLQETLVASSLDHECEALYVNHVILELAPDVDHRKLRQAWMTTAEDHEILRTCFCEFENRFVQFVFKKSPLSFDWSQTDAVDCVLSDLRQRESHIAFNIIADIETKPPIKLTLADSHGVGRGGMLLISLHHALYDADSFSMLLDEVYVRYQGNPSTVLHTPVTALVDHIDSQRLSDAKAFWTKYLVDYKPTPISSSSEDSRSRSMSRELITSLTEMENLAASMNGTPATVMQALFGVVLAETLQTHDVVFGTILSGRTVPVENAHSILAPCITTIPQRVQIGPSSSPGDVIRSAQEGFVESLEYQHTALRDIHRWTEAKGQLFDSLFTYTRRGSKPPWSHLWREVETSMSSGFPLAVEVVADQVASCISVQCHYTAAFGTFEKANSLLERMQDLLRCLVRGEKIALKEQSPKGSEGRMPSQPNKDCWTKDEMLIRSMISDMTDLDTRSISKDASFFALGLDSIVAIQLAKRLRQHHMPCSSANVMRYPSVAELGQHIASSKTENPAPNGSVYRLQTSDASRDGLQGEVLKVYPCTPLQSSMLTQTLGSDASLYVHHHAIRFSLGDNAIGMKQAWEQVVARTEILRTGFDFSGETNTWSGIVYKRPSTIWNEYDKDTGVERAIPQIKQAVEFREVKDFARPPWRVDIVGDVFILSLHHSLYDGESMRLLFSDFWALKRCYELPMRPPFSQAAEVIDHSRIKAEDYWVRLLAEFHGAALGSSSGVSRKARAALKVTVANQLEVCKSLGVTLQSVALLAFGKTIAWMSGQQDVVFGHVVRGRTLSAMEADDVIGPLFNTVPMRVNLERTSSTNRDVAQGIQRLTGESQAYQHGSLSKVQQAWREQVGNPDAELFDSLFVFQRRAAGEEDLSWESVAVDEDLAPTEYMTNFEFEHTDTEINICVNSRTIQDPETIIQNFQHNLCDVLQCPGNPAAAVLRDLPRLNGAISHHTEVSKPGTQTGPDPTADMLGIVRRLLAKVSGIKVENIAENASIFSIGLDSISAIQVAASARKEGLGLTVADVLRGRTPKGICQSIVQRQDKAAARGHQTDSTASEVTSGTAQAPELLHTLQETSSKALALAGLRDDDVEEFSPCLPGQYYHLLAWLQSGRTLGEGTFMYSCKEALDPNRLFSAWRTLRERHATLRTVFVSTTKTEVMQAVLKPAAVRSDAFQCIEFTPFGVGAERELLKQTACRRFDLFSPPVELFLARDNVEYRHVVLKLHHALYDAWTIGTIVDELSALYQGRSLPPIPSNASLVRSVLHSGDAELPREYWQKSLDGCQETILSSASQPPKAVRKNFFFANQTIPGLRQLETRCQQYDTSLPTLILVAFARALAHSTAVNNPIFGIFQTGRSSNIEGLAESCVPCLNMTPLIVRGALTRDCKASIEDIQSDLAARVPFEQSSLHDVFEWTGWGQRPLFNTFVNILWSTEVESRSLASEEPLLSPWTMEDLEDVAPSFRLPGRTAIDGLDTSLLADENLFLDVRRCASENELRIVVRCDYGVLDEEEAGEFVGRIVDEVAGCVDSGLEGRD